MKQKYVEGLAMDIDYELFSTEEIVKIFNFFSLIEKTKHSHIDNQLLLNNYNEYRRIINNKTLEKQYDKKFEKLTGISIYKTIEDIKKITTI